MRLVLAVTLVAGLLTPFSSLAKTWVIAPDSTGDFPDIRTAIDTSAVANWDTLSLTNGVFTGPGNRRLTFNGKALTVISQSGDRDSCIIDCGGYGPAFHFRRTDGSNHTLESITITNGFAYAGGGICCDSLCSPTIRDCVVMGNQADIGGGIACFYLGNPTLTDCKIENNFAGKGAGIYTWVSLPVFRRCVILMNQATEEMGAALGGGVYSDSLSIARFDSCVIVENLADVHGGGMFCTGYSHDSLFDCHISMNEAGQNGGGMYCAWAYPRLVRCVLNDNLAGLTGMGGHGGGIMTLCEPAPSLEYCRLRLNESVNSGAGVACWRASPHFSGCLIDSNTSLGYMLGTGGGGVLCDYHSDPSFIDTDITRNLASVGGAIACLGFSSPDLKGCTLGHNVACWYGGGICCLDSSEAYLEDCDILGNTATNDYGGGAVLIFSDATFKSCRIDSNDADRYAGGAAILFASPEFDSCSVSCNAADSAAGGVRCLGLSSRPVLSCSDIEDNRADLGGGVACYGASPEFHDCSISMNVATSQGGGIKCDTLSSPVFAGCIIDSNEAKDGGGIMCHYGSPLFEKCRIRGNAATYCGGGAFCSHGSASSFINCLISRNYAGMYAGGLESMDAADTILHCTFSQNSAVMEPAGVIFLGVTSVIKNSIIAYSAGTGIIFAGAAASTAEYCDYYGNAGGDIGFQSGNPANGPPGIGILSGVNVNGDSCDVYWNIFENPVFADTTYGDYSLSEISSCLHAGNAAVGVTDDIEGNHRPAPPTSPPDLGAYENQEGTAAVENDPYANAVPPAPVLYQNEPNPFRASTEIRYALPKCGRVTVEILDVRGREVACPVNEEQCAGMHVATFNVGGLSSGVYFVRLVAGDEALVRKVVVLR